MRLVLIIALTCACMFRSPAFTIVDGYMDRISYRPGDTALVYVNASIVFPGYKMYLSDVLGNRRDSVTTTLFPQGITNPQPWENGFGYQATFTYIIPQSLPPGIYNWCEKIFFIVKNPLKNSAVTIVYPSNTEAAYNNSGGKSLYDYNSSGSRAGVVSFQRPLSSFVITNIRAFCKRFLEWIDTRGYDIQYIADADLDNADEIARSKILVVIGHSEYWSKAARLNLDAFVDGGKHAVILSGNTMWWQVRYTPDLTRLVCYKDANQDPEPDMLLKTVNWPDTLLHYPVLGSIGADFVHGAYGMKTPHGWYGYKILHPESPLLESTGLVLHDTLSCQSLEYDGTLLYPVPPGGDPVPDTATLGFCKTELIGYDLGKSIYTWGPQTSYGTFIVFKKGWWSGHVVNTGFSNWCSKNGDGAMGGFGGPDSMMIKQVTCNILDKLLADSNIYSTPKANCTGVGTKDSPAEAVDLLVSPNPGTGEFRLSGASLRGKAARVVLYNTLGRCVFSGDLSCQEGYLFSVSFLTPGIYFYSVSIENRSAGQGKLVMLHPSR